MTPKATSRFVGSLFAVLLLADSARSETETIQTDADTLVWSANPTFNFGVSQVAYVGRRPPKSVEVQRLRALLHFDLSALPANAVVNDATLRLFVNETITDPLDLDVTVSRLEEDFVEGNGSSGVTWNTQPAADPAFAQSATVDVLDGEWFEMDLTLLVLAARQSGEPDDLWLRVAATDETTNEDRYFSIRTKQHGAGADRAQVVIDYELPEIEEPGPEPDLSPSVLDPTVPTLMGPATEFLYTGSNPIQTGVSPGTIEPSRAAVIRGQVREVGGDPLSGVAIAILNEPDYGNTVTRSNGMFDIAVNGGGLLTVTYSKDGYLPVQRLVDLPSQDYVWANDVVMIAPEDAVSVDPTQAGAFQVAQGAEIDEDDEDDIPMRQATLLFPEDVTATATLPNGGGTEELTPPFDVRLTEFTLDGNGGPDAMPAELPPTSGYTYAVDLSIDEALDLEATKVTFSEPVIFYVQNFLDFPVGTNVPLGYYDREKGQWVAADNGRVIKIVSIDGNNLAELDTDTTAGIDNGTALGITTAERGKLATLYSAGQELWRTKMEHFTPWDLNWGFEPEDGAEFPGGDHASLEDSIDDSDKSCGSIIGCQNQSLGESIALTGTPFRLHYNSRRSRGYVAEHTITIPLGGTSVPSVLRRIELFVDIAGRRFAQTFTSSAFNQKVTFRWDGLDGYGRVVQGKQRARVGVGYVYGIVYRQTGRFGYNGDDLITSNLRDAEVTLWRYDDLLVGNFEAPPVGLCGWTLNAHHSYTPHDGVLHLGTGETRSADMIGQRISTVAGTGVFGNDTNGGAATITKIGHVEAIDVGPDGSLYIADEFANEVRRVDPDGVIHSFHSGPDPLGLAVAPNGGVYIAYTGFNARQVFYVDPTGTGAAVAGTGQFGTGGEGDGGQAMNAKFATVRGLAVAPDGTLYIVDEGDNRVRAVDPEGIIRTVAGGSTNTNEGVLATTANLNGPTDVAIGADGSLYISVSNSHRVRRVTPSGHIFTVAGNGNGGADGDGGPAVDAELDNPRSVALDREGNLYIADTNNHRIRRVDASGVISTLAGDGTTTETVEGLPLAVTTFDRPLGLAFTPDRRLLIADQLHYRVRSIGPPLPGLGAGEVLVPAEAGNEVYVFDSTGRHQRTHHALTGAMVYDFKYDENGLLDEIEDGDEKITSIERDEQGVPTAIVGPYEQTTELGLDDNEYLAEVTNPADETYELTHGASGLLTRIKNPRGHSYNFLYDSLGRLIRDVDPASGFKGLSRTAGQGPDFTVELTTALGRTTTYQVQDSGGALLRTNTAPDETVSSLLINPATGSRVSTAADGTITTETLRPDPRFGMAMSVLSTSTETPLNDLVRIVSVSREPSEPDLAITGDPLSLANQTDTVTINGQPFQTVFDKDGAGVNATITQIGPPPESRQRVSTLDDQGRVKKVQVTGLYPIRFEYHDDGRLEVIKHGPEAEPSLNRVTTFTYKDTEDEENGYLDKITDAEAREVEYEYDDAGRVITQTFQPGTQFERVVTYAYDANGNLISLTPPDKPVHSFTYTPVDLESEYDPPELVSVPDPETTYTYNADRQLTLISRPDGKSIVFGYGATTGRLDTVTLQPANESRTYTYDEDTGQLTDLTGPGANLSFTHDGFLPETETWDPGGAVTHIFDDNFRQTGLKVNSEATIVFGHDNEGLLTNAGALTIDRDPDNGLITGTTLDDVTDTWVFSDFGELASYEAQFETDPPILALEYQRDKLGRITKRTETTVAGPTVTFYRYDPAGRLWRVCADTDCDTIQSEYLYDANGNRTGGVTAFQGLIVDVEHDDQDLLRSYETAGGGLTEYEYNENGDLTAKTDASGTTTYTYDALGNLRIVDPLGSDPTIEYLVDGRNRRVGKKVAGTVIKRWLYKDQLKPVAELDGSGNLLAQFVYGSKPNVPDYMVKYGANAGTYRIVSDHLGSVRFVVNADTGSMIHEMEYDEFGNVLTDTNEGFQPFGFAGGIYDPQTGLVRFGARDYDPYVGRWTIKDPILFRGGDSNLYAYVLNSPVNLADPPGLWGFGLTGSVSAEAGLILAGAGATGAVGVGIFGGGAPGLNVGGFFSGGGFVGTEGTVFGAFIGGGGGVFFSNASCSGDLAGSAPTYSFNLGYGPIKFTVQCSNGSSWICSVTAGPGLGVSVSGYSTTTK